MAAVGWWGIRLDSGDQLVSVSRDDSIGDDRAREISRRVQTQAGLAAGADEVLDKIHPSAMADPAVIIVHLLGLYDDVEPEHDCAEQSEIPE